ncbi:unnamed protein product [Diatraea saccharalis]|uniref:Uncharacterized protein n=1 Tax=Diatraea saccharalis TaxID=40085 RepID=A0A9N9QYF7_9NEOP|nr:unnamed protein product [Diatraea saccharalis]
MDPEDIANNCQFVPLSAIQTAIEYINTPREQSRDNCKRKLLQLQKNATLGLYAKQTKQTALKDKFHIALTRAIYSHDWNKLLYLLKKSPIWQQSANRLHGQTHYIRALAILMMFYPAAQSQGTLQEYIHMVCSCRTAEEKKALMKLILTLPEKIVEQLKLYPFQRLYLNE